MKVVLFCGGYGTRLREHSETIPKPMVAVGERPMLWHLMRYYAHFGHREFLLCLGYGGDRIRQFFRAPPAWLEARAAPGAGGEGFAVRDGAAAWHVTLVETGEAACVGERLYAVRGLLAAEPMFLANYSDALSDLPLDAYVEHFRSAGLVASLACVRPHQSFHTIVTDAGGLVSGVRPAAGSGLWINGGFFAFRREIFDYLRPGEDLVAAPLQRLIDARQLVGYRHAGFWSCMDTLKDKIAFDAMEASGATPWKVWATA